MTVNFVLGSTDGGDFFRDHGSFSMFLPIGVEVSGTSRRLANIRQQVIKRKRCRLAQIKFDIRIYGDYHSIVSTCRQNWTWNHH